MSGWGLAGALLAGASMGGQVGASEQRRKTMREGERAREAQLRALEQDGEKRRAALTTAAMKIGNRDRSRSLFNPSGEFAGELDVSANIFGV